jgi:UV DNA damage endonuclease
MDTILGTSKKEGKGLDFAKDLGRQNAADLSRKDSQLVLRDGLIVGMLEWNERFGIRFMRLSSEMFPFASHAELGYTLGFAKPELSAAGRIAMKYNHRLTMHPVFPSPELN